MTKTGFIFLFFIFSLNIHCQLWNADLGNNNYKNPILFADYSDPDVIRVGEDFFMTASSFNCVPALPVLHSKDLVNWKIVNYAIKKFENPYFDIPQHGNGVWAPAIRYHDSFFYIYYGDPDRGIYMVKTSDPTSEWTAPVLVKKAYGNIDPCPFWDDDGKAYLVHAFAYSRAGVKSLLQIHEMNAEGTKVVDKGTIVYDGHKNNPTIEGPKLYKKDDWYYIFAPAGGVTSGWQTALRSKNIYGPYEDKIVLHQGNTQVNGPHQGALVELESGDSWFIHFQDKGAFGRILHLQPVEWTDDWPFIGVDIDNDGVGEPVNEYRKPIIINESSDFIISESDEFNTCIGLQWQWHANPQKNWTENDIVKGYLKLNCIIKPDGSINLWNVPNLLLQKFPAPAFSAFAKLIVDFKNNGDRCGLLIMGTDYAYIGLKKENDRLFLYQASCLNAENGTEEIITSQTEIDHDTVLLKVEVSELSECIYFYSIDDKNYIKTGEPFIAKPGKWIGAKTGVFAIGDKHSENNGYVNIDWYRISNLNNKRENE
ncbi:MAG: glycoside hydrolase 43 family protein [Bacteroidales bacterium]|nr:glycoside hydrolase 43 family protein [Bacteroidales bacterium]